MPFEFNLPTLEQMRSSPDGLEMLRMIDDDDFRTALITGCPGSGKTTVSIYRLVRLNSEGLNVHLVTFQNMLVLAIRSLANSQAVPPNRVSTFHKWFCPLTRTDFNVDNPPASEEIIQRLTRTSLDKVPFDELIVDEGQDLPASVYAALPQFCRRFFAGADNGQQVHPKHGARIEHIEASFQTASSGAYKRFSLGRNFRNTYETYKFARQFIARTNQTAWNETILERLDRSNRHGAKPIAISYTDPAARDAHMRMILANATGNVAILCPLGPLPRNDHPRNPGESVEDTYESISKMGIHASKYHHEDEVPINPERYIVTTFKSAKGMEFDTVIVPRINFFKRIPEEWYVACTRARRQLYVYRDIRNPQKDPLASFDQSTYESGDTADKKTEDVFGDSLPV